MSSSKGKGEGDNYTRKQHLEKDLLCLMRIKDFLCLILSYPMRIGNEKYLEKWIVEVSYFAGCDSEEIMHNFADDVEQMPPFLRRKLEDLLSKCPLRYVEGLIPEDIIGGFIFNESKSEELTTTTSSTSKETQLKQVPEPILDLATRLAVQQLTQTLTPQNKSYDSRLFTPKRYVQNIRLSTRNDVEKQTVVGDINAKFHIADTTFQSILVFDVNQTDEEFQVLELATWLEQITSAELQTKDDNVLLVGKTERHKMVMSKRHRHLVLLVDGDGDKKLEPQKVRFPNKRDSADVVVFITTESSARQNDELTNEVDLGIRTRDHLLPWEVFCRNVGSDLVRSSCAIQRIAVQIVEECGNHLLAIVLVAKSLKDVEDVQIWKLALEKLRYPNPSYKISDSKYAREVMVNAFINIIWADAISEREKPRLARCLRVFEFQDLMSDNQLFACWFLEQLIDSQEEAEHTLRELLERSILLQFKDTRGQYFLLPKEINFILDTLQENNTHEDLNEGALGFTEPSKVWDWHGAARTPTLFLQLEVLNLSYTGIRGLPSSIYKLDQLKTLSLKGCKQLKQLPAEIAQLQNIEKLDLDGTAITHLPQSLNFPKLRILLLGGNLDLMEMPPSFFNHMPLLSILDLSRTGIHDLPSSFSNLEKLGEFYLKDCELFMELPTKIDRLQNLKTLDLDGTQIRHLPNEIQELTNLESLSLSFSGYHHNSGHGKKRMPDSSSAMIPFGFISKLTHLKYLRIDVNPDNEWWHENVEHILAEIVGLERLRTLHLYVPEIKLLKHIPSTVSDFRFIVGHHMQRIISRAPPTVEVKFKESNRSLKFVNGVDFPEGVKNILQFAEAFFLDRHLTINSLSQFGLKNLRQLRSCILAECNEMQNIVDGDRDDRCLWFFFRLEFLTIFYMKNLRSIVNCPTFGDSTSYGLKFLALHTCPELTTIFTMHFLDNLVNLEELIVEDCPKVSSIISCQSSELRAAIFLPRLRKLSLLFVPELVSISNGLHIGRNLEKIGFYYCPKLESLSSAELSSEKLEVIRGEIEWWERLKWSKAEWGREGRPDKFNRIFFPIDEELDVLTQLSTDEVESSSIQRRKRLK